MSTYIIRVGSSRSGTREAMLFTHPATRKSDVRGNEKDEAVN
jgi:hypothetical protein